MNWAVDVEEWQERGGAGLSGHRRVGCQLFDDLESARRYALSCKDNTHTATVRKARHGDREFA